MTDHTTETDAIRDLSQRIDRAINSLAEIRSVNFKYGDEGYKRLTAKIEGVALVGSYVDEILRATSPEPTCHPTCLDHDDLFEQPCSDCPVFSPGKGRS